MDWKEKIIAPEQDTPPKVDIRFPCPGLFRFFGMIGFLGVALGAYYAGLSLLGLPLLDWTAPDWTTSHVILVATSVTLGAAGGLLGAAIGLTIPVRNIYLNNLFICLWQFLANGSLIWLLTIGIAMSVALGKNAAKVAVMSYGAEQATLHVVVTGCMVGLILGFLYFVGPIVRMPLIGYLILAEAVSLIAARLHFDIYHIDHWAWGVAGLIAPILLLLVCPGMIERDRRQRHMAIEQLSASHKTNNVR